MNEFHCFVDAFRGFPIFFHGFSIIFRGFPWFSHSFPWFSSFPPFPPRFLGPSPSDCPQLRKSNPLRNRDNELHPRVVVALPNDGRWKCWNSWGWIDVIYVGDLKGNGIWEGKSQIIQYLIHIIIYNLYNIFFFLISFGFFNVCKNIFLQQIAHQCWRLCKHTGAKLH